MCQPIQYEWSDIQCKLPAIFRVCNLVFWWAAQSCLNVYLHLCLLCIRTLARSFLWSSFGIFKMKWYLQYLHSIKRLYGISAAYQLSWEIIEGFTQKCSEHLDHSFWQTQQKCLKLLIKIKREDYTYNLQNAVLQYSVYFCTHLICERVFHKSFCPLGVFVVEWRV